MYGKDSHVTAPATDARLPASGGARKLYKPRAGDWTPSSRRNIFLSAIHVTHTPTSNSRFVLYLQSCGVIGYSSSASRVPG
jgi:hypothetical protein